MTSHDTAFEQWFLVYAEAHKLPKGSPFRVAIWHHCMDAWKACEELKGEDNAPTRDIQ